MIILDINYFIVVIVDYERFFGSQINKLLLLVIDLFDDEDNLNDR